MACSTFPCRASNHKKCETLFRSGRFNDMLFGGVSSGALSRRNAMKGPAMFRLSAFAALLLLTGPVSRLVAADENPSPAQVEFFEKSVRPVLANQCQNCHNADKQKGGLRLDSRAAILRGGDSGPAAVAGKPEVSLLIKAVHYKEELRMPPKNQLKAEEIQVLATWIKQGLPWPATAEVRAPIVAGPQFQITEKDRSFWSFQPIRNPPVPAVREASWARDPIDHFLLAAMEGKGLKPSLPADRPTLLRRVTFDLTGLPPTPEEIDAFVKDNATDALARVVDRLLASPAYGERWARLWLDIARYGEDQAHSFQPRLYPHGFRYRDWLIKAFNEDMPYDRFVKEQIAGDLLPGHDKKEDLASLGFFALGPVYYGDPKRLDQYDDRIDTLCRGFLGLTVACARCHDHKFDPISQKDYYALAGVVASSEYHEVPLVPPEEVEKAKKAQTADEKKKKVPLKIPLVHALKDGSAVTMRVHIRGNPDTLGEEAPRRFLAILGGEGKPFTQGSGRLELAEAIASKDNPLTARVIVNRIWQAHFGKGLVRTTSNFGKLGEKPTHPELLDHLASRFIAEGWSIKKLHRALVLSAAYQQVSTITPQGQEIDPENRLVWRMNRRRLEVEAWRDSMLAVCGTLDRTIGGPSLDLFAADNLRRTLYGKVSRHELNSLLRLFDFPDPNLTTGERTVTTVPLQQLFVLNSDFMVRNARTLASRLTANPAQDDETRIRQAFLLLYGRPVTPRELQLGLAFVRSPMAAAGTPQVGLNRWEQYAQVLLAANEFMYVD